VARVPAGGRAAKSSPPRALATSGGIGLTLHFLYGSRHPEPQIAPGSGRSRSARSRRGGPSSLAKLLAQRQRCASSTCAERGEATPALASPHQAHAGDAPEPWARIPKPNDQHAGIRDRTGSCRLVASSGRGIGGPDSTGADRYDRGEAFRRLPSSTLRADCSIRNASSMNQTVARRSPHSASCQATKVRSHRAGVRTTVNACRTRCLNAATLARRALSRAP
jgi:hypothetical protein